MLAGSPELRNLPIVDISALTGDGSDEQKLNASLAIDEAFRTAGFLYVVGHGVDASLCKQVLQLGREFFLKPEEEKNVISIKNQAVPVRGYQRIGDNVTKGHSDWHEAIDLYRELPDGHQLRASYDPMHSANQWPTDPKYFKDAYTNYVNAMLKLGGSVMEGIARARRLAPDYFVKFRSHGCLTFVNCENVQGALEVRNQSGQWMKANPVPGAFIVNVGDMLSHWSNGVYRSTPHRVQSVAGTDRVSVPFFFEPNYDARISPIESFGNVDPTSVKQVVFGEHLSKRVLSNFKYSPNLETDNSSRSIA
ncbi:hypothetical protein HDU97_000618 [Phlyctochytrium planicorne]|nr:hypothetical protein HDU97_000618 [Phlyctochytrium planicorne]